MRRRNDAPWPTHCCRVFNSGPSDLRATQTGSGQGHTGRQQVASSWRASSLATSSRRWPISAMRELAGDVHDVRVTADHQAVVTELLRFTAARLNHVFKLTAPRRGPERIEP